MNPELLDITGNIEFISINDQGEVVAYSEGNIIVVWNLSTDQKVHLHAH